MQTVLKMFTSIASALGTDVAALRLLASLLFAYPISYAYRYINDEFTYIKHFYFISTGLLLCWINYGVFIYHSLLTIFINYAVLKIFGGTRISVGFTLCFAMGYLLWGCWITQKDMNYTVTWTMTQCVLTLRLIAMAFDLYDGARNKKRDTQENPDTAINHVPNIIEFLSHSYFPGKCTL